MLRNGPPLTLASKEKKIIHPTGAKSQEKKVPGGGQTKEKNKVKRVCPGQGGRRPALVGVAREREAVSGRNHLKSFGERSLVRPGEGSSNGESPISEPNSSKRTRLTVTRVENNNRGGTPEGNRGQALRGRLSRKQRKETDVGPSLQQQVDRG